MDITDGVHSLMYNTFSMVYIYHLLYTSGYIRKHTYIKIISTQT